MKSSSVNNSQVAQPTAVGRSLLEFAKEAEFSARRGVVADIYPYVLAASKRMSARAIARFLDKEQGVVISPVTIAKAIRNPKKYCLFFYETFEPSARLVSDCTDVAISSLLFDEDVFERFCAADVAPKFLSASNGEEYEPKLSEYREAVGIIAEKWFSLDAELRIEIQKHIEKELVEFEAKVRKDENEPV